VGTSGIVDDASQQPQPQPYGQPVEPDLHVSDVDLQAILNDLLDGTELFEPFDADAALDQQHHTGAEFVHDIAGCTIDSIGSGAFTAVDGSVDAQQTATAATGDNLIEDSRLCDVSPAGEHSSAAMQYYEHEQAYVDVVSTDSSSSPTSLLVADAHQQHQQVPTVSPVPLPHTPTALLDFDLLDKTFTGEQFLFDANKSGGADPNWSQHVIGGGNGGVGDCDWQDTFTDLFDVLV